MAWLAPSPRSKGTSACFSPPGMLGKPTHGHGVECIAHEHGSPLGPQAFGRHVVGQLELLNLRALRHALGDGPEWFGPRLGKRLDEVDGPLGRGGKVQGPRLAAPAEAIAVRPGDDDLAGVLAGRGGGAGLPVTGVGRGRGGVCAMAVVAGGVEDYSGWDQRRTGRPEIGGGGGTHR